MRQIDNDSRLPNEVCPERSSYVYNNANPEDGNDGKTLARREFQAPDKRHWQSGHQEVGKNVDHAGREENIARVHACVFVLGLYLPVGFDRSV